MKNKTIAALVVLVAVALFLIIWGSMAKKDGAPVAGMWGNTEIACLPNGHVSLALHIHQVLSISVNGQPEVVPGQIGINASCMAEVHTHDETGKIHVETADLARNHTLGNFFAVWGKSIDRPGYALDTLVNGKNISNPASHILAEGDVIALSYTKI